MGDKIIRAIITGLGPTVLVPILLLALRNLRKQADQTATDLDNQILEALIGALETWKAGGVR